MGRRNLLIIAVSIILAAAALLIYKLNNEPAEAATPPRPNIILISIDTLRADHLGCYGYSKNTSPNIDRFAGENVLYKNAFAQAPYTLPSHASMFTSLYPNQHLAVQALSEDHITMAEMLKVEGYATYAITGGGLVSERFGLMQGFDSVEYNKDSGYISEDREIHSKILTSLSLLKDVKQPFFLFLHSYQVHVPYLHPKEYDIFYEGKYNGKITGDFIEDMKYQARDELKNVDKQNSFKIIRFFKLSDENRKRMISHYDQGIYYTDTELQIFFDALKKAGMYEDSLIVLTSDHGDEFFEHGGWQHGHTLYNELIHVPMIIKYPGFMKQKPAEYDFTARLIDILPTMLDVIQVTTPYHLEGQSLVSNERKESGSAAMMIDPDGEIFKISEISQNREYKYIQTNDKVIPIDKRSHFNRPKDFEELYDLENDWLEATNIIESKPEEKQKLVEIKKNHINSAAEYSKYLEQLESAEEQVLDPATIEQLKTLGYIQ